MPLVLPDSWLLISDVDDTLLGEPAALERLLGELGRYPHVLIALNSSRPLASVHHTLRLEAPTLQPAALVGAMGTEVELRGKPCPEFSARFAGHDRSRIDRLLGSSGARPHDPEYQTPFKASFAVPKDAQESVELLLKRSSLPIRWLFSGETDLDVLPAGADKGAATLWVAQQLGVPHERCIVAGDSANDLSMFQSVARGIVVANARAELKAAVGGDLICRATRSRAAGLLEGLRHHGALPPN